MDGLKYAAQVEKWDLFEIEIQGKQKVILLQIMKFRAFLQERMRLLRLTVFMTVMAFIECGLCHLLKENIALK